MTKVVRQGLSPPYPELSDTGTALRLARVAMTGSPRDGGVTAFDEAPLSVTAVAEPEVMRRVAETVLGPLESMRPDNRPSCWTPSKPGSTPAAPPTPPEPYCSVTPTPSGSGFAGSRNAPRARCPTRANSPNYASHSKPTGA